MAQCLALSQLPPSSPTTWPLWSPGASLPQPPTKPAPIIQGPHLLTDEAEASVRPLTLVGLPQDRVEGFAARSVVCGGVGGDSKGCNIHLREKGQGDPTGGAGDQRRCGPTASNFSSKGAAQPGFFGRQKPSRGRGSQAGPKGGSGLVPCARRGQRCGWPGPGGRCTRAPRRAAAGC